MHFGEHVVFVLEKFFAEVVQITLEIVSIVSDFLFCFGQSRLTFVYLTDFLLNGFGFIDHQLWVVEVDGLAGLTFQIFVLLNNFFLQMGCLLVFFPESRLRLLNLYNLVDDVFCRLSNDVFAFHSHLGVAVYLENGRVFDNFCELSEELFELAHISTSFVVLGTDQIIIVIGEFLIADENFLPDLQIVII